MNVIQGILRMNMLGMDVSAIIWAFVIYSFLGWFYESTIFSLGEQGKFINKGYFIGPICPIYGCVFFLNVMILGNTDNLLRIFLVCMLTCTVIEFITSYVLEKMFQTRYWDYSYYPLNLNGRISVPSSVFFGLAMTFIMKLIHPAITRICNSVDPGVREIGCMIIVLAFFADAIVTYICMKKLNRRMTERYEAWDAYVDGKLDVLNEKKEVLEKYRIVQGGMKAMSAAKELNRKCVDFEKSRRNKTK